MFLSNPASPYHLVVKQADDTWVEKKRTLLKEKWGIEQYFPFPTTPLEFELEQVLEMSYYEFEATCSEGWEMGAHEFVNCVEKWAALLRNYYDELTQTVAHHRDSFRAVMTSKNPKIIARGYIWPYKAQHIPKQIFEKHGKEVRELRPREMWEPEYYCSYCDHFVPHSQRHQVTEKHPHHAMCWCKSCTFHYDRMCNVLRTVLTDLSRCEIMSIGSKCLFATRLDASGSDDDE